MPLASNLKLQDYQFELSIPAGKWRWKTRLDVSQSNPTYSIRDIESPYGLLRDSIPLPGDVILAMSTSIEELRANFSPSILLGPPTSLDFFVDEARGFSEPQSVSISNNGVYGSILGVTITSTAPYLRPIPANIGNLAMNETGQFDVDVDSSTLLASGSPYNHTLTVQDPGATNSPQVVPVTITVRPKATISALPSQRVFTVVKPISGSFPSIPTQNITVHNSGPSGSVLDFDVQKLTGLSDWLVGIMPSSGQLTSFQTQAVVITVQPPSFMVQGTYTETLRVSGFSTNTYVDVEIQLVIT